MNAFRWIALLACFPSLQAEPFAIVGSRSPDGRWSLICDERKPDHFEFSARSSDTGKKSELLDPSLATENDDLMFGLMASAAKKARLHQSQEAESYHVSWNRDASLLAIQAGAHKFGHFLLLRRNGVRFSKVAVPIDLTGKLVAFVRAPSPKIHEMGVNRFRSKDPVFEQYPEIFVLENGWVAVSTYGAQCSGLFQDLPEDLQERVPTSAELYFLLRVGQTGPATFHGFCR